MLLKVAGAAAVGVLLAAAIHAATASEPDLMDGWYSYDYQAGLDVDPPINVYRPAVKDDGTVWVNHRQWSIDDPENPPSILALSRYEDWSTKNGIIDPPGNPGEDLRGECVSFYLRGDNLDLNGADVTFWVMALSQRWHTTILDGLGDEWVWVNIDIDDADWRNSWAPDSEPNLRRTLGYNTSMGIGFVGFDGEPTGRLAMREFEIGC